MKKTNFGSIVMILAAFIALALFAWTYADKVEQKHSTTEIMIAPGQTLWALSAEYCPENMDRREWVYTVRKDNGIKDTVQAWQTVVVLDGRATK